MAEQSYAEPLLQNGLLLADVPMELRTQQVCLNAMKWALHSELQRNLSESEKTTERRERCFKVLELIPPEIVFFGFCGGFAHQLGMKNNH